MAHMNRDPSSNSESIQQRAIEVGMVDFALQHAGDVPDWDADLAGNYAFAAAAIDDQIANERFEQASTHPDEHIPTRDERLADLRDQMF